MRTSFMTIANFIGVGGLVHHQSPLGPRELSVAVTTDGHGTQSVDMIDVLAMMRVDASAEVLVASDASGCSVAIPIRQILEAGHARIIFANDQGAATDEHSADPAILSVANWTDDRPPFMVVSLHAMSFKAFLGLADES